MLADPKRKTHQDDSARGKRRRQEQALDEALRNTFPASDPVSIAQPAGRDFLRFKPLIEGSDDNSCGLEDSQ
jgi:hypothetical protein